MYGIKIPNILKAPIYKPTTYKPTAFKSTTFQPSFKDLAQNLEKATRGFEKASKNLKSIVNDAEELSNSSFKP